MRRGSATVRLVAGLALTFALAAALAPFAGSRALAQPDNNLASITIYTAICPAGFDPDRLFEDCYDTPGAGIDYFLTDPNLELLVATSGPSGLAAFEGLSVAGEYALQVQYPSNLIAVRCSEGGNPFPFAFSEIVNQILLDLTTADDIRCDVYLPPKEPAPPASRTLTIYKATCPVGYDDDDYFEDCFENATTGVTFFVTPLGGGTTVQDTTDAGGFASFKLAPGGYVIEEDVPGEFAEFFAYCSAGGQRLDIGYSADGSRIALDVPAGQGVRCDWYNLPFDLRGETPTPTPAPTQPVTRLPSTGAGGEGGQGMVLWPLVGTLALLAISGAGMASRRRLARAQVCARQ